MKSLLTWFIPAFVSAAIAFVPALPEATRPIEPGEGFSPVAFAEDPPLPRPLVPRAKELVQPEIEKHQADQLKETMKALALAKDFLALYKLPCRVKAIEDPWAGMAMAEENGLKAAAAGRKGIGGLPELIDVLGEALGKPAAEDPKIKRGKLATLEDHAAFIMSVLDRAKELREAALAKLSDKDRKFVFEWTAELTKNFGPQLPRDKDTERQLKNDRAFCAFMYETFDWAKFAGSARALLALTDPDYLKELKSVLEKAEPIKDNVPGVTGDILFKKDTPHGLILFGGKGKNTYKLTMPVAFLVDLDGDDEYSGTIASSFDVDHPFSVVIDMAGNDTYDCSEFGLACGRLGVGILLDLAGKDTYKLAHGSGGTGFCGIGILCDAEGDDTYTGSTFTQGSAIAGVGVLLDLAGDDKYTSFGMALGLGGPAGIGAVIDVAGNDSYQCGKHFPSGYNESDAPNAKPEDPQYQWDAFGMGMGLGRRIMSTDINDHIYALAGGVGMIIDIAGNDKYESSNFSQACGYYFGVGIVLDLAGDDVHAGARYGHASGAHSGMGLFIDYAGKDTYTSTGPTYNCGCAWDRSVMLFIEGAGDDTYQLERSAGPGRADIHSWGIAIDLAGKDKYVTPSGLGQASQNSIAVFFDAEGDDDYEGAKGDFKYANCKTNATKTGGLFVDK